MRYENYQYLDIFEVKGINNSKPIPFKKKRLKY